ncbi:MAG: peptide chain release factor 1 [Candidatus Omnitrophica bacterium CG1_02_49_10]|nr:MAG: peptide chain release factor 1 [Candidatus Omnitrophica bacterium CG1_02_49_10]
MLDKFKALEKRYEELHLLLSGPDSRSDMRSYKALAKELSGLTPMVSRYKEYCKLLDEIGGLKEIIKSKPDDAGFAELADEELRELMEKKEAAEKELEEFLIVKDPYFSKNIIMEIRAGTGGLEANLFAGDIFRMYSKYAAAKGWRVDVINSSPGDVGGFKEMIFSVEGDNVYGTLKFESGVHRVQRVPETEGSGRIHTSAVTVAVLPEAEEVDIKIEPNDIKVDVYRSSGCGGQSVNTTDSAVRLTHLPTGLVVTCQDERSQLKNRVKAMKVLRARLMDKAKMDYESKISKDRKSQVGTGDRSEKIRTYNFPDGRVTDHRIKLTLHKLDRILEGDIDELITALKEEDKKRKLTSGK